MVNRVLDCIPTYLMSLFKMPVAVEKKLNAMRSKYLWEGNSNSRKFHLIKWQEVMEGKKEGVWVLEI